jgi:hypothetical protein
VTPYNAAGEYDPKAIAMVNHFLTAEADLGKDAITISCRIEIQVLADERKRRSLDEDPATNAMDWVEQRLIEMFSDGPFPVRIAHVGMSRS